MNKYHYLSVILILFLLIGCSEEYNYYEEESPPYVPLDVNNEADSNPKFIIPADPIITEAEPYLNKIITNDMRLRSLASTVTKGCVSGNKECQLDRIYNYVVDNYDYYSDPRGNELIQTPYETLSVKGGDCEDLTIFMSSLLENLGIKTYLVLTDNHVYSLACGIDVDRLSELVINDIKEDFILTASSQIDKEGNYDVVIESGKIYLVKNIKQTMALNPGYVWYYGGDGSTFFDPIQYMDIKYSVSSSEPLDIFIVPSDKEYSKIANDQIFTNYPSCKKESIYRVSDYCDHLGQKGGIVLVNTNHKNRATVYIDLSFYLAYSTESLFSDESILYYKLGGEQCVVLEATAGKYGFPGYDSTTGEKIAVDPVTKKYYSLN